MRNIWTIKSGDHESFRKRALGGGEDLIIFLKPGEYNIFDGFHLEKRIVIKGIGNSPEDVVIHGSISMGNGAYVKISNLTMRAPHERNALNMKRKAKVTLDRVIIHGERTGEYPALFAEEVNVDIFASEFYTVQSDAIACYFGNQSVVNLQHSIFDSVRTNRTPLRIEQCQIGRFLHLANDSKATGIGIVDLVGEDDGLFALNVNSGSIAEFEQIHAKQNDLYFNVEEAQLAIQTIEIPSTLDISLLEGASSQIHLPGDLENVTVRNHEQLKSTDTNQSKVAPATGGSGQTKKSSKKRGKDATKRTDGKSALEQLHELYGLHRLKEQVMKFINTVKYNQLRKEQGLKVTPMTLHSVFMGNPGTGKTTVARLLGRVLYENGVLPTDHFIEVTRKDLVSEYIGQTAQKTQEILERSKGGILFIDEAYALHSESEKDFGKEVVDTLIPFMEDHRDDTMVIFAGYTDDMNTFLKMNSGLESRVPNQFYFDDYTPEEIAEIGYKHLTSNDYIVDEAIYKRVIQRLYAHSIDKSNARWVRNINERLIQSMANRVIETGSTDTQTILEEDFRILTGKEENNKEQKIKALTEELESLIGLSEVKDYVNNLMKQVKVDQMLLESGSEIEKPSYHMIFAGNPGTGKTTVANIIAELFYHLNVLPTPHVKVVDRSDLVGAYIGHTEKQTKEIIEQAMGGVLFIDEAYQLTAQSENDFGRQAVETLLTYLENYRDKFIVILAGYTDEMEKFLDANPGLRSRIPLKIIFPDYTPDEIAEIVELIVTKNWEVDRNHLRKVVKEIYMTLPAHEQANGRWARNFAERLIQQHKVWLSDHDDPFEHLKVIHPEVIEAMKNHYTFV